MNSSKRRTKVVERKERPEVLEVTIKQEDDGGRKFVPMSERIKKKDSSRSRSSRSRSHERRSRSHGRRSRSRDRKSRTNANRSRSRERRSSGGSSRAGSRRQSKSLRERRSSSPYSVALNRWHEFKRSEDKMLDLAKEKLDKYDASPEDHPQYADEWAKFWQRRYAEVKDSGQNPDDYDFLEEWIPFWSQRSREMLDAEVESSRAELLKKFRLDSNRRPERKDFKQDDSNRGHTIEDDAAGDYEDEPSVVECNKSADDSIKSVSAIWRQYTSTSIKKSDAFGQNPSARGSSSSGKTETNQSARPEPKPKIVSVLRLIGAFQELLGDLNNRVDDLLQKALSLEKSYEGASRILAEDQNIIHLFQNIKKQLVKGQSSVDEAMLGALENCIKNIDRLTSGPVNFTSPASVPSVSSEVSNISASRLTSGPVNFTSAASVSSVSSEVPNISASRINEKDSEEDCTLVSSTVAQPPKRDISELLTSDAEAKRLLCEAVAVVLLQTGRRSFTREGLYNVMAELMKKLESSESDNRLGDLAKQFNAAHLTKMAMKPPSGIGVEAKPNPTMDHLTFTPDELVCLLRNFETLSWEERTCFNYYMQNLQRRRDSLSQLELNILDLYLVKAREVDPSNQPARPNTNAHSEPHFRPVSFDYSHKNSKNGSELGRLSRGCRGGGGEGYGFWRFDDDGRQHGGDGDSYNRSKRDSDYQGSRDFDDRRRHHGGGDHQRHSHDRRRHAGNDDRGHRDADRGHREAERGHREADRDHREADRGHRGADRGHRDAKVARREAPVGDSGRKRIKRDGGTKEMVDLVEVETARKDMKAKEPTAPSQQKTNPDGSVNLSLKYKTPGLNLWVRNDGVEKALFKESPTEAGALLFECTVCNSKLYGVKNVTVHLNGKKHANQLETQGWTVFDPLTDDGGKTPLKQQPTATAASTSTKIAADSSNTANIGGSNDAAGDNPTANLNTEMESFEKEISQTNEIIELE